MKRESEGGDDDDTGGGIQTGKGRRRNVEKHLAAERERRKHVKEKLQVSYLNDYYSTAVIDSSGTSRNWIIYFRSLHLGRGRLIRHCRCSVNFHSSRSKYICFLNMPSQTAIEFVKRQKSKAAHTNRRQNKSSSGFPAFDSSPLLKALSESYSTGFVLLNNEWDIMKVGSVLMYRGWWLTAFP